MNIKEIRYRNARSLVSKVGKLAQFAEKIGKAPAQVSSFAGEKPRKGIGDDMALHIEECFNLPRGWMDRIHEDSQGSTPVVEQTDKFHALLRLGKSIEDFTPGEILELEAQVELIRRRKSGGF